MVILTVGGLVSNTSDVNEWQTRGACGNLKGSPSTSSNLFQAATMNRSYRTNDTNDNPSVWIPPRRTSGLFLCVCQTDVQTCSTSSGISMFHEGPLRIATSLYVTVRLANLCKPHSTSMVNLVGLTRTCLNMLH